MAHACQYCTDSILVCCQNIIIHRSIKVILQFRCGFRKIAGNHTVDPREPNSSACSSTGSVSAKAPLADISANNKARNAAVHLLRCFISIYLFSFVQNFFVFVRSSLGLNISNPRKIIDCIKTKRQQINPFQLCRDIIPVVPGDLIAIKKRL